MKLECYSTGNAVARLVPARQDRAWMDAFDERHAYRCLPLSIANSLGWDILTPCTIDIEFSGGVRQEDIKISSADGEALLPHVAMSNFSRGIVTFHTGYLFRTNPDWQLLATGPFNAPKDGLSPLTGVIETGWLPYPFTMNWQLTRPGRFRFEKGEPFCHIMPIPHGALEDVVPEILRLDDAPDLKAEYQAFKDSRTAFMDKFRAGDRATLKEAWQKFYFRGRLPTGTAAPANHSHKVRLASPIDRRGHRLSTEGGASAEKPLLPGQASAADAGDPVDAQAIKSGSQKGPTLTLQSAGPRPHTRSLRVVTREEHAPGFLYRENVLSSEHCHRLLDTFERRHNLTAQDMDKFFANRVLWMSTLPAEEVEALRLMQQARFVAAHLVGQYFRHGAPLFDDGPQLVKWSAGHSMPAHMDNQHPDGSANATPWRLYAGVLFLNDDFEGGVLYFDRLGLAVRPKPGLLIGFKGGPEHSHGVTRIVRGNRYTMPMWFTDDVSHASADVNRVY